MKKDLKEIYQQLCSVSGSKLTKNVSVKSIGAEITKLEKQLNKHRQIQENNVKRINQILEVVISLANLNYTTKAYVSSKNDYLDALASGINMLGEELQSSTVSLHEKEILLKEVHHRVKNNLQVISSLLNLQTEYISDKHSLEKFNESINRIKSMALVHEKLYKSKDLSKIDFKEYIQELVLSVNSSYNLGNEKVKTSIEYKLNKNLFDLETAIPCGLIINELLSNCYKYAFPQQQEGKIEVCFSLKRRKKQNYYHLKIKDNGIGIPENFTVNNATTLGLQLVFLLTEQLSGEISTKNISGTEVNIYFPE